MDKIVEYENSDRSSKMLMVVFPLHLFLIFAMEELREEERPQTL